MQAIHDKTRRNAFGMIAIPTNTEPQAERTDCMLASVYRPAPITAVWQYTSDAEGFVIRMFGFTRICLHIGVFCATKSSPGKVV